MSFVDMSRNFFFIILYMILNTAQCTPQKGTSTPFEKKLFDPLQKLTLLEAFRISELNRNRKVTVRSGVINFHKTVDECL